MDAMAAQLRIREITKGGVLRAEDIPELRELAKKIYHPSALEDIIFPLMTLAQSQHEKKENP